MSARQARVPPTLVSLNDHARSNDMKTLDTERIRLYSVAIATVAGWALLIASLAESLLYPTIV